VTPSNVLLTEAGMPMLADLGVARLLGDGAPVHSTPAFIDPAVAAGCVPGPQSDVFMLGAVTLYALTGRPLWRGDTPAEVLASAAAGETGDIDALLAAVDVPEAMRAVLSRALSVEPSLRGSAAEFALDLRHAGTPLAVELSAGRQRVAPALPMPGRPTGAHRRGAGADPASAGPDAVCADPARPGFDRPTGVAPTTVTPLLTHAVRPRPRPLPARRARRGPLGKVTPRWAAAAAGALTLAAAAAAGVASSALGGGGLNRGAVSPPASAAPASAAPASAAPASASPAARSAAPLDASGVSTVLARLDERRQQAFAGRNTALLGQVYLPGPLLSQDTALLERLVPAGCRLVGVYTNYDHVPGDRTQRQPGAGGCQRHAGRVIADVRRHREGSGSRRRPGDAAHHAGAARVGLSHCRYRAVISDRVPTAMRIQRRRADG
jgi:eukaryotic-like serine/threonine-protein kinase